MPRVQYTAAERKAYGQKMAAARAAAATPAKRAVSTRARRTTVSGRGFYRGVGKDVGSLVGGLALSPFGLGSIGSRAGGLLGGGIEGAFRGRGAYSVNKNVFLFPSQAKFSNSQNREGATLVEHREFIGEVQSSTGFEIQYELPLNPAQNSTFPWLSTVAQNYSQYEMMGAIFMFESTSGSAVSSTNSTLGEVIMTSNPNSLDASYISKTQMLNADFCTSAPPSTNSILPIECAPLMSSLTTLYTRSGEPLGDKRMADLGTVTVATSGQQEAGLTLGNLYVVYSVYLMKPQLSGELGINQPSASYALIDVEDENPLGQEAAQKRFDNVGITVNHSTNTFTLPRNSPGLWKLSIHYWHSSTVAFASPNSITIVNGSQVYYFKDGVTAQRDNSTETTSDGYFDFTFTPTDSSKICTIELGDINVNASNITDATLHLDRLTLNSNVDSNGDVTPLP